MLQNTGKPPISIPAVQGAVSWSLSARVAWKPVLHQVFQLDSV
jgi:hypothetical protein